MINKILSWIQTFLENWTLDTNVPNAVMKCRNASVYIFELNLEAPLRILNAIYILYMFIYIYNSFIIVLIKHQTDHKCLTILCLIQMWNGAVLN